jgi:hypothetical protein
MEINVWIQWFVRAANSLSSLLNSSTAARKQGSPISSPDAQGSDAGSSSTSKTIPASLSLLQIKRNPRMATANGVFGVMVYEGEQICFTMENRALAVAGGTYSLEITYSPHFGREMPLLDGTSPRTDIRIHPANWPTQLEGCVAVGQSIDGDSLSNSELAFEKVFGIIQAGISNGGISIQISGGLS